MGGEARGRRLAGALMAKAVRVPQAEVMPMFVVYHPGYTVDIGPNHRFPMQKYRLVYEHLLAEGTLAQAHVIQPDLAAIADLLLVHTRDYVDRFLTGAMSPQEMRLLGFPWSAPLARRARL